jgi:hypothetical protein
VILCTLLAKLAIGQGLAMKPLARLQDVGLATITPKGLQADLLSRFAIYDPMSASGNGPSNVDAFDVVRRVGVPVGPLTG